MSRSSRTDNAAAVADKQMQTYRTWSQISSDSNPNALAADLWTIQGQSSTGCGGPRAVCEYADLEPNQPRPGGA